MTLGSRWVALLGLAACSFDGGAAGAGDGSAAGSGRAETGRSDAADDDDATTSAVSGSATSDATGSTGPAAGSTTGPVSEERCDGTDNDGDGLVDEISTANSSCNGCSLHQFGDHAYWFCDTFANWFVARDACRARGADLAAIDDPTENGWINSQIEAEDTWWLGGNDIDAEGQWEWVDGTAWTFDDWAPGEPNDAGNGGQDCMMVIAGSWDDNLCILEKPYVCRAAHVP